VGKVRYLGASSMWAWQFAKMQHAADRNGWTPRSPRLAACTAPRWPWPGCCRSRSSPRPSWAPPGHLDDAVAALDVELSADEIARLEEPYTPHPVAGFA
jgi:aryl-alcohol dehydrogenase-like predicted oxidoreductase